jgi:hypothetical protein
MSYVPGAAGVVAYTLVVSRLECTVFTMVLRAGQERRAQREQHDRDRKKRERLQVCTAPPLHISSVSALKTRRPTKQKAAEER